MTRCLSFYLLLGLVAGCSGFDGDDPAGEAQNGVLKEQTATIEKARAVELQIHDAAEKQREAIERQGG
jgi:hypothetical protein